MYYVNKWLSTLDLQTNYANPKYDLASGLLVSELIYQYGGAIKQEQLTDAFRVEQRRANWDFINGQLKKSGFTFSDRWNSDVESVICQQSAETGQRILCSLFVFFTGERLIEPKFKQEPRIPLKNSTILKSQIHTQRSQHPSSRQVHVYQVDEQRRYRESFLKNKINVEYIFRAAYEATYNYISYMNMFYIFETLRKVDAELDDCDEDLKNVYAQPNYNSSVKQIFEFAQSAVGLANIFSDSTDEEVCRICFHQRFLSVLGESLEQLVSACCVNLQKEITIILRLLNIYYYAENDIIFLYNKNLTNAFIIELISALSQQNRKSSHFLYILMHQVILMLPEEYMFATNQFMRSDILLRTVMNSHLPQDNFYATNFYFMENRLPTSSLNQGIGYEFKRGKVIHYTTFVCSILSKFLLFHPKIVAKMINSYVFRQMNISNYHLLNCASKEYLLNQKNTGGAETGENGDSTETTTEAAQNPKKARNVENDEFIVVVTEYYYQLTYMNNLQLLLMDMLVDYFAHSYYYCKPSSLNIVDVAYFFIFYALYVDILKFDNTQKNLFLFSYLTKRKSMVVLYFDILTQLVKLLFYNIQIVYETEDVELIQDYVKAFSQKYNSQMSLIFKCVQIIQRYIMGMSDKYLKMNVSKQVHAPKYQVNFYEKLQTVVYNFICSESDYNIHGVLYSTSSICEALYDIIERFVDLTLFLYSDRHQDTQIMKFLIQPPTLEGGQIDEQFLSLYFIIQQLSSVCTDLVDMISLILTELGKVREDKAQNKTYSVIDMELDEEPLHACMADLHRYMKKIF